MNTFKKIWAEFIGTFFIIFIGCGAIIIDSIKRNSIGQLGIALCFAASVMIMIFIFRKTSGSHFNPAVSFTFFITGKLSLKDTIFYILSQFGGGILAGLLLCILFAKSSNLGGLKIEQGIISRFDISPKTFIILSEFIFSFFLMFVYAFSIKKNKNLKRFSFILIGGVYFITVLFLGQIQGAGLNPIRIIIPSVFTLQWQNIIFYLIGVFLGSLFGGISYRLIFSK